MRDFSAVPPHGLFIKTQVARTHFAADKGIADDRIADNGIADNGIADDDRRADGGGAGTGCAALSADRRVLLSNAVVPCMLQGWRVNNLTDMQTLVRFIGSVCLMLR
jgi:hypothetical protein